MGVFARARDGATRRFRRARLSALIDLRNSNLALVVLASGIGAGVGLSVVAMRRLVELIQRLAFDLKPGQHLSEAGAIDPLRILVVICAGGLLVGLSLLALRWWRPRDVVDAIEANALHGGRMSLGDSAGLAAVSVLSAGVGASVGLEAAYTQLGSGIASKVGQRARLRRADLRTLVGCGAAAAIGAAFNTPLAGAFYAFELIMGSYSPATLVPISAAAVAGTLVARATFGGDPTFVTELPLVLGYADYVASAVLGIGGAGLAILTMRWVTAVENWFRRRALPLWLRPAIGGAVLAGLAMVFPQVLGSGHGVILHDLGLGFEFQILCLLILAKIAASALSIGAGFRGGLFSASLLIGCLFGSAVGLGGALVYPELAARQVAFALVGMGAVAAGVVGAPVTMTLLVLETTANLSITIAVVVGIMMSTLVVRSIFGYSFATWRFHLRGVAIRGGHDVGWIGDLNVQRLMRRNVQTVPASMTLAEFRERYPIGQAKRLYAIDDANAYQGLVDVADAHASNADPTKTLVDAGLVAGGKDTIGPDVDLRTALARFEAGKVERLTVVTKVGRQVLGDITEAYLLRRYTQELERLRREEHGESGLFAPPTER
jgi:CIC family chloride channel protein